MSYSNFWFSIEGVLLKSFLRIRLKDTGLKGAEKKNESENCQNRKIIFKFNFDCHSKYLVYKLLKKNFKQPYTLYQNDTITQHRETRNKTASGFYKNYTIIDGRA